jgi:hypothetical protein
LARGGGGTGDDDVDCGFQSDRYLPYQVGFHWEYRVSDPVSGMVETKSQWIDSEVTFPGDGQPALLQVTDKSPGVTRNYTRLLGEAVVRLQQEDVTALDVIERITVYQPYAIRIDEAADRIAEGATFQESFTEIEYDAAMVEQRRQTATENWEVVSTAEACSAPIGTLTCLHLRRVRTGALVTQKDFWLLPASARCAKRAVRSSSSCPAWFSSFRHLRLRE